jgi:competence protein ComGF
MALRIEYIILISLTVVSIFIFIEKPVSIKVVESNSSEEVYFKNFMLLEVNEDGVANQLTASEGIKYRDSFKLSDINITYQKSHNLLAQKAIYVKDFIHLEGNIRSSEMMDLDFGRKI